MGDMKDALRKAGLVSDKEARQAAHRDRVRRKELGEEGLAAERRSLEVAEREEAERRRHEDQARDSKLRAQRAEAERDEKVTRLITEGDLLLREGGPKRFYFEAQGGRIYFLDVSDQLSRRLAQGDAAIVDARGVLRNNYTAVSGKTAAELRALDATRILFWNAER